MRNVLTIGAALALAACPAKSGGDRAGTGTGAMAATTDGGAPPRTIDARPGGGPIALPPAPPVPRPPAGLPALPADLTITAAEVALGELLFHEPRLGADGTTACASCHDPSQDWSGTEPHPQTAAGRPSLRRAASLSNLAWAVEFGWDGRGGDLPSWLPNHARGQQNQSFADTAVKLAVSPTYAAHLVRAADGRSHADTVLAALSAYVLTRFVGASPWDGVEANLDTAPPELVAGYKLFTGKALCASCHPPPLYTDNSYHRLGLIKSPDEGRGRVDAAARGAFKTPGLRGATRRALFFHDGSATSLEAAVDWHLAGGRGHGADPSVIDPGLPPVALLPEERGQLLAFVRALTAAAPPPARPTLPTDLP
jgi:cytochrome c peroxidase